MECRFPIAGCKFHYFSFAPIDSRMYLLIADKQALVVDPCRHERVLRLLNDMGVKDVLILPTHEHYDHIAGINWLKTYFKCKVMASEQCAKNMANPSHNLSAHFEALFIFSPEKMGERNEKLEIQPYVCEADEVFSKYVSFTWKNHKIEIQETPGHSKGSVCIIFDSEYIFTGDSLIKGVPVITRLPGGSRKEFVQSTLPFLKGLPKSSIIFPGHGESGYIRDFL